MNDNLNKTSIQNALSYALALMQRVHEPVDLWDLLHPRILRLYVSTIETGDRLGSSRFSISRDRFDNTVSLGHPWILRPRALFYNSKTL